MLLALITLYLLATASARPDTIRPEQEAVELLPVEEQFHLENLHDVLEEHALEEPDQPEELNRKKKQVTTFCVEIRPSNHRPFQVCDPYGGKEQHQQKVVSIKPHSSEHFGGQSNSKSDYSEPIKTYPPSENSVNFPPSNNGPNFPEVQNLVPARAAAEEDPIENELNSNAAAHAGEEQMNIEVPAETRSAFPDEGEQKNPVPTTQSPSIPDKPKQQPEATNEEVKPDVGKAVQPENEPVKEPVKEPKGAIPVARTPDQTYGHKPNYNHAGGHRPQYIPVTPVHNQHHSGLVITCQPNLAGYAHGMPYYHPGGGYNKGGQANYNYRAAAPTFGKEFRPYSYGGYGGYGGGHGGGYGGYGHYKPQAQLYQGPVHPYPMSKPMHHKKEGHYKHMEHGYDYSHSGPQPPYSGHHHMSEYGYGHHEGHHEGHHVGHHEGYHEGHHEGHHLGHHEGYHEEHYDRSSDKTDKTDEKLQDKEQHTLEKMEEMSKQRLADIWVPEGMEEVPQDEQARREAASDNMETKRKPQAVPEGINQETSAVRDAEGFQPQGINAEPNQLPLREDGDFKPNGFEGRNAPENGGWRSAGHEVPTNDPAKELSQAGGVANHGAREGGGWRNSNDEFSPNDREELSEEVGSDEAREAGGWSRDAEGGGWRSANSDLPANGAGQGNFHDEEARGKGQFRNAGEVVPVPEKEVPKGYNPNMRYAGEGMWFDNKVIEQ